MEVLYKRNNGVKLIIFYPGYFDNSQIQFILISDTKKNKYNSFTKLFYSRKFTKLCSESRRNLSSFKKRKIIVNIEAKKLHTNQPSLLQAIYGSQDD